MRHAFTALVACASLTIATARADDATAPQGLSTSDWSGIRAAYEANRHTAQAVGTEFHARNFSQRWKIRFDGRGFLATPDGDDWSWGLELVSFGREGAMQDFETPLCIDTLGGRVSYEWDDSLTEWYINDRRGLEHGFTVHRPPQWVPSGKENEKRLQITLAVRGDFRPQVSGDCRSVAFVDMNGAVAVAYSGLKVFDADGVALHSWFETALPTEHRASIELSVDDTNARYPLTIDPIAQQAYLKASNSDLGDQFGQSVAVSGDTVVVGAYREGSNAIGVNGNQNNNGAAGSGAAYVFVRIGTTWSQQAYLKASNTGGGDSFGYSVAASGDTIVVGAWEEDSNAKGVNGNGGDNSFLGAGAAYVFVRIGVTWSQQAYLKASNPGGDPYPAPWGDAFGYSVAVDGDAIVVGALGEDSSAVGVNGNQADDSAARAGAAYVFVRSGVTWSQQAYLKASNTNAADNFGRSVSISGDTVVVGANEEDSNAIGINGNQADNSALQSGAAYVFVRSGTTWSQQAYLKASNADGGNPSNPIGDQFGSAVALSGDTAVIGAFGEDSNTTGVNSNQTNNSATLAGAAYVFVRIGTTWSQQAYLKASNTGAIDQFGISVAVSGNTLVVGAFQEDSNSTGVNGNQSDNTASDSGAAYIFVRNGTTWNQQAYLKASNTGGGTPSGPSGDYFGRSVAVSGNTVVVGAELEDSNATGVNGDQSNNDKSNSGAAYVFTILDSPSVSGDMNCDGLVNMSDLPEFVQVVLGAAGCNILNGDMNSDIFVNGADIQGFVDLLVP